jgi:D-xylose transport system permease protein
MSEFTTLHRSVLATGAICLGLDLIGAGTVVKYVAEGSILVPAAIATRGSVFARGGK